MNIYDSRCYHSLNGFGSIFYAWSCCNQLLKINLNMTSTWNVKGLCMKLLYKKLILTESIKKQLFEKTKTVWKPICLCEESQV